MSPRPTASDVAVRCIECGCITTLASLRARLVRDRTTPVGMNAACVDPSCSCHDELPTDVHLTLEPEPRRDRR